MGKEVRKIYTSQEAREAIVAFRQNDGPIIEKAESFFETNMACLLESYRESKLKGEDIDFDGLFKYTCQGEIFGDYRKGTFKGQTLRRALFFMLVAVEGELGDAAGSER